MVRWITQTSILGCMVGLVLSYLGFFWWLFDVLAQFSFQLGLTAVVFVCLSVFLKWRRVAFILVVLALPIWFQIFQVFPLRQSLEPSSGSAHTVMFSNIFLHNQDMSPLINWVQTEEPDVLFVAEVTPQNFETIKTELTEYVYTHHQPGRGVFGMAVFSKQVPSQPVLAQYFSETSLPTLELILETSDGDSLHVLSTHPYPPGTHSFATRRNDQLMGLASYLGQLDSPTVLVGDLNATAYSWIFKALVAESGLNDTRKFRGRFATWPSTLPAVFRVTIDHALVSDELKVVNRKLGPDVGSDHRPLLVEVEVLSQ